MTIYLHPVPTLKRVALYPTSRCCIMLSTVQIDFLLLHRLTLQTNHINSEESSYIT